MGRHSILEWTELSVSGSASRRPAYRISFSDFRPEIRSNRPAGRFGLFLQRLPLRRLAMPRVALLIWLLWASALPISPPARAEEATRPVLFPSGTRIEAEVADTDSKRALGLMFRESLSPDRGMLFIFPRPAVHPFWMKNCRFPIDILWLGADKTIVRIIERVPPCPDDPCPVYDPRVEALYAIEVAAGFAQREGLKTGMKIRF
jgi:uncharacterized membrane protein (UPF0127 family)